MGGLIGITGPLKCAITWPLFPYEQDGNLAGMWWGRGSRARKGDLDLQLPKICLTFASFVFNYACVSVGQSGCITVRIIITLEIRWRSAVFTVLIFDKSPRPGPAIQTLAPQLLVVCNCLCLSSCEAVFITSLTNLWRFQNLQFEVFHQRKTDIVPDSHCQRETFNIVINKKRPKEPSSHPNSSPWDTCNLVK